MALFDPDSDTVTGPEVPGAPAECVLDVDDIQGAVTPGFGTKHQHLIAVRFPDGDALRDGLRRCPPVSTLAEAMAVRNARRAAKRADPDAEPPRTPVMCGISLTIDGLRMLTPDADDVVDIPFRGGMRLRSVGLGDPTDPGEDGHRDTWRFGGTRESTPHLLVVLAAQRDGDLDDAVGDLLATLAPLRPLWEQRGTVLDGEVEHFGFRDGVSQVGVRGRLSSGARHYLTRRWLDPGDSRALTHARPGQPLVWPGQFAFGYPAGTLAAPLEPGPTRSGGPTWTRNGSLLVLRRLRQDVAAFEAFVAEQTTLLREAGFTDMTTGRLAALVVGRWPDGGALMRNPRRPDPADASDMLGVNAFGYANAQPPAAVCADPVVATEPLDALAEPAPDLRWVRGAPADPPGALCPKFAHIRKVNPRDLVTDQEGGEAGTRSFQMLRRGITWGRRFRAGEPAAAADRGLLFMSYQTDIENQFELLTTRWMNLERAPELDHPGHDLLVGQRNDGGARSADLHTDGHHGTLSAPPTRRWVIPTGGGYFFTPSASALRTFAQTPP